MTQEDRELLLKDLCARLPYGVICYHGFSAQLTLVCPDGGYCVIQNSPYAIETVKPYLRPMSSMTEEERKEFNSLCIIIYDEIKGKTILYTIEAIDWLNTHHFDYRGLIEKGLALEAPEGMYNINEK